MILPRMIESMFPKTYQFIWQSGWTAGKQTGERLFYESAIERLDRWELKDLKNLEFKLGYNHARKVALNELSMEDFENMSKPEEEWRERRANSGVDRTTES